ncbi:hypothetical protein J7T55_006194 [Diaporthe amygdali]|uniref:uncharacterized protein n=1 Tax=Phomopsis amygdali TaxID=1214568 RepID=UPI0022FED25D|nr:uncharacterized protein J7T55_006194 [Diaporthe amygdali]KAJ0124851.1 hypothetical protein J7T55_006194 [Diaporthe amygdali]
MGILTPRESAQGLDVIESSRLTYFPITLWDIRVIAVLWTLFFVTGIFVILRLFSRVKILQFYAIEDYLYNVAFTLLLAYNGLITFYSYHGLGSQLPEYLTTSDVTLIVAFENVLFDLASIGLVVAKSSLVVFLMRLAPQHQSPWKWNVLIVLPITLLGIVTFGAIMAMWARCFTALAGTTLLCSSVIPAMHWMQVAAGFSVAIDLWYAAMPWYLLRRLTRPKKEKILIQGSMSLGVIAAGCGIARALTIYAAVNNLQENSVLYLWHGAEMAVTMICIGLPVSKPAYISIIHACGMRSRKSKNSNLYPSYAGTYRQARERANGEPDTWSQREILTDTNAMATKESFSLTNIGKTGITVTKTVDVTQQSPV